VNEISVGRKGSEIIQAILTMAGELNIRTIAEGIETNEQLEVLKQLKCQYGQGFLLSRPMESGSLREMLLKVPEF
jgi:EAL domain-containing protein (putative c-di-GMP-specific phosphodiesterase class I)